MIKILGALDVLAALSFIFYGIFHLIPSNIALAFVLYLLLKGAIFTATGDKISVIDLISGVFMLVFILVGAASSAIVIIISLFLFQKGVISFF